MKKCELCGRPLEANEEKLCPACKSDRSHKKKRLVEYITLGIGTVLGIIFGFGGFGGGGKKA